MKYETAKKVWSKYLTGRQTRYYMDSNIKINYTHSNCFDPRDQDLVRNQQEYFHGEENRALRESKFSYYMSNYKLLKEQIRKMQLIIKVTTLISYYFKSFYFQRRQGFKFNVT